MKFTAYKTFVLAAIAALFVACDPLDEVYDEIDAVTSDAISAEFELTLTDEDYELLEDVNSSAARFGNFDNPDEPGRDIPVILNSRFPHLGQGSAATVYYDFYAPVRINNEIAHTVSDQEYQDMGQSFGNFNDDGDITSAAAFLYPNAENEDVLTLTYDYFTGSGVEERTSKVVRFEGFWYIAYEPTPDDYRFMGQRFNNFDSRSTGRARIATLLDDMFPFADEGDVRTSVFTYTFVPSGGSRQFVDFLVAYRFDGSNWIGISDATQQNLQFGHDGSTWVPDNTIRYTLENGDYASVATQYAGTPYGDNLDNFGNFNRTGGGTSWSDELMVEALGYVLSNGDFVNEEGQKYLLTVVVYNGSTTTEEWNLIYTNGEWVLND